MKRAALIITVLALALSATAALAATKTLKGGVKGDPKSKVALQVKTKKKGERQVRMFVAKDFLISCTTTQARLESAAISGRVRVNRKGRFEIKGSSGDQKLKVKGKLTGKRNAKGKLRYSGPTPVDGETQDCDSGKLRWRATG